MRASLVDVSRWQESVNVQQIMDAGFVGIVARCTIGWSYLDPIYASVQEQARAIPGSIFGAYHVLWPKNDDAQREANWYLQSCGDVDLHVLDVELLHELTLSEVQAQARTWMDDVKAASDLKTLVYTGSWFWNQPSGTGLEDDYDLWEAEYTISQPRGGIDRSQQPEEPQEPEEVAAGWNQSKFWQWTSGGKPIGVESESLDYNVFMGTEAELRAYLGLGEPPLTDKQKLNILWEAHPELHP